MSELSTEVIHASLPPDAVTLFGMGKYRLASGTTMNVLNLGHVIQVVPEGGPFGKYEGYEFCANASADGIATFSIVTRDVLDPEYRRHPDMNAIGLMRQAIDAFAQRGHAIKEIQARWQDKPWLGDNWRAYQQTKQRLTEAGGLTASQCMIEAAATTWTGRAAKSLGFGVVREVVEHPDDEHKQVDAFFAKARSLRFFGRS